jgi:hypothetical protein
MRSPDITHPVHIALFWRERGVGDASKALASDRLNHSTRDSYTRWLGHTVIVPLCVLPVCQCWAARFSLGSDPYGLGLLAGWIGTEAFHRGGKQQLSLGDCQVRGGEGQIRYVRSLVGVRN